MNEKAKFVCFIYMQPQNVKFKSVQINMNMSRGLEMKESEPYGSQNRRKGAPSR